MERITAADLPPFKPTGGRRALYRKSRKKRRKPLGERVVWTPAKRRGYDSQMDGGSQRIDVRIPLDLLARLDLIADWEAASRGAVLQTLVRLGLEVYETVLEQCRGRIWLAPDAPTIPSLPSMVDALGSAAVIDATARRVTAESRGRMLDGLER